MTLRKERENKKLKRLQIIVKMQVFITQESWIRNCRFVIWADPAENACQDAFSKNIN